MTRLLLSAVAAVMAQASNCSLSDPEHLRLAATLRDATRGCDVVVFTTVAYSSRALLPSPATRLTEAAVDNAACYVVVAHGGAAFCGSVEPWRIVEAGGVPGRRASRAVKLRPLLFFPDARHIVFLDWKLRLKRTPASLIRATVGSGPFGFAAFRHPCTAAYTPRGMKPCPQRRPNEAWWRAEARDVLRRGGTEDAAALRRQVERYERAGPWWSTPTALYWRGTPRTPLLQLYPARGGPNMRETTRRTVTSWRSPVRSRRCWRPTRPSAPRRLFKNRRAAMASFSSPRAAAGAGPAAASVIRATRRLHLLSPWALGCWRWGQCRGARVICEK